MFFADQGFDSPMLHAEPEREISRVFLCRFWSALPLRLKPPRFLVLCIRQITARLGTE